MPKWCIRAAGEGGKVIDLISVDSASQALLGHKEALRQSRRVWTSDETGDDVSLDALTSLALTEAGES